MMSSIRYRFALCAALCCTVGIVTGCGGKKVTEVPVNQSSAVEEVRKGLEGVMETGAIDSSIEDVRNNIGRLRQEDEAKGAELMKDIDELSAMKDSAKIKARAKEMLEKL
ncbi:hypothetical protein [Thalassoglobus polymorphus]|uniref:Uncharacterized protein n=1 Tax=Thalassoglobus polymorphus TaxID=2527994 RepID=A0A517QVC4_9PLAN|nr:hypothetical protein [Thalassoglobus polymorphus]QDT35586.1 hypothetical protein Mal48_48640 [Thalassoglobus polymorphus]